MIAVRNANLITTIGIFYILVAGIMSSASGGEILNGDLDSAYASEEAAKLLIVMDAFCNLHHNTLLPDNIGKEYVECLKDNSRKGKCGKYVVYSIMSNEWNRYGLNDEMSKDFHNCQEPYGVDFDIGDYHFKYLLCLHRNITTLLSIYQYRNENWISILK